MAQRRRGRWRREFLYGGRVGGRLSRAVIAGATTTIAAGVDAGAGAGAVDGSLASRLFRCQPVVADAGGSRSARRLKYSLISLLAAPVATSGPTLAIAPPS